MGATSVFMGSKLTSISLLVTLSRAGVVGFAAGGLMVSAAGTQTLYEGQFHCEQVEAGV